MTSLKEILDLLPLQKKKPDIPPWNDQKVIKFPGGHLRIELDYRSFAFEREPSEPEFTLAFKFFYDIKTNKQNAVNRKQMQSQWVEMWIPKENPKICVGVDIHKKYVYFRYEADDVESKNIVEEFIALLLANRAT